MPRRLKRKWIEFPMVEYHAWYHAVSRCHDPRNPAYTRYGGRGIKVCERWRHDFMQFLSDMGLRPSPDHSLDRRDNDGGYAPENCRWTTHSVQMRNTERVLRAKGAKQHRKGWRAEIGINGRRIWLGQYASKSEASRAYRQASKDARLLNDIAAATMGLPPLTDRCAGCVDHSPVPALPESQPPRKQ